MNDAPVLLQATGLTKDFTTRGDGAFRARTTQFRAVDDVGFAVRAGETLGIVGESGSGKSTTARMIAKLIEPTAGTITFDGEEVTTARGPALAAFRTKVQVVFQDPFSSLNPRHTVERIVSAPLDYQGITPKQGKRALVRDLLDRVGLNPDHLQRYPRQFSGGQAQRIGIARALAVSPKLVICDEAVSALDVSVQARIIDLLRDLQAERHMAMLLVTHNFGVVADLCDRVTVMQSGLFVETGPVRAIFQRPEHPYTKSLLASILDEGPARPPLVGTATQGGNS